MKILCIGAGAIGICIGGSLAAVGADVTFLIKPQQVKNMQGQSLTIINQGVSHPVTKFEVVNDLRELKGIDIDCVLIAVKAFDTEQVIKQLKDSQLLFKSILCLQNGVENEGKLREAFPQADIIGASIVSAVSRLDTTTVRVEKNRGIGLCGSGENFQQLFEFLTQTGLKPRLYQDLNSMKWSKMISNLFSNATSGILDMTPMEIYSQENLFRIEKAQIIEGLEVMKGQGIAVSNLPGLPLKALVFTIRHLPDFLLRPLLIQAVAKGRGEKMPSFYIEKMKGSNRSEVNDLNGAIVRAGVKCGIETPVNRALVQVFNEILADPKAQKVYSRNPELLEETIRAA